MIKAGTLGMLLKCPNCDRVFNLYDEKDAQEWYYGHDCFIEEEEEDGKL